MSLLAIVAAASLALADSASRPATDPQWAVSIDDPVPDEPFAAWLVLPVPYLPREPAHRIAVRLANSPYVRAWFPAPSGSCAAATGDSAWTHAVAHDTALTICVPATGEAGARLIAVVVDSATTSARTSVAVSGILRARPRWYDLGPTLSGIVTAALAFAFGVGATIIQQVLANGAAARTRRADVQRAERDHETAMERAVVNAIGAEWTGNASALRALLGTSTAAPPQLRMVGYNTVLGDTGVIAYLSAGARAAYLRRITPVYESSMKYNEMHDEWLASTNTAEKATLLDALRAQAARTLGQFPP